MLRVLNHFVGASSLSTTTNVDRVPLVVLIVSLAVAAPIGYHVVVLSGLAPTLRVLVAEDMHADPTTPTDRSYWPW